MNFFLIAGICHAIDLASELEVKSRYYTNLAAAAQCDSKAIENWTCEFYCTGPKVNTKVFKDEYNGAQMYIKVDDTNQSIILSFRATVNLKNRFLNGETYQSTSTWLEQDCGIFSSAVNCIKFHFGFLKTFDSLASQYEPELTELLVGKETYKLICIGHSLGGAMASIATLRLHHQLEIDFSRIELYTYGQPRTGNTNFAKYINENIAIKVRYVNENDYVPKIVSDNAGYQHHQVELWKKSDGSVYLADTSFEEDPNGSISISPLNTTSTVHKYAWGIYMGNEC